MYAAVQQLRLTPKLSAVARARPPSSDCGGWEGCRSAGHALLRLAQEASCLAPWQGRSSHLLAAI